MKICIIGFGNIAKNHIDVFRNLGQEIVASSNRSEKGNLLAKEYGVPKTYSNYIEMVEIEKPDAIINCVSFQYIFETTKNLIPYRIPLLIEKPAGLSLDELQTLIFLQKKYKTIIQVGLNRRHYSVFNKAIKLIGGVDNLNLICMEWSEKPLRAKLEKGYSDDLVAKLIIANSIHGIDTLNYFSGGIEKYSIFTKKTDGYFGWNMILSGQSKTGCLVNFSSSWECPVPWRINMYGSGKRIEFAPLESCRVFEEGILNATHIEPDKLDIEFKAGFHKQSLVFYNSIEKQTPTNPHSLESTINSMTIAEQMLKSFF